MKFDILKSIAQMLSEGERYLKTDAQVNRCFKTLVVYFVATHTPTSLFKHFTRYYCGLSCKYSKVATAIHCIIII